MSALVTPCHHLTAPRSAAGRAGAGAGAGAGGGTPARCISAPRGRSCRGWGAGEGDCIIHHTLNMCRVQDTAAADSWQLLRGIIQNT